MATKLPKHLSALLLALPVSPAALAADPVSDGNQTIGKVSKRLAEAIVDGALLLEALLYVSAVFFLVMFVFSLVKWKKTDGRDGSVGLIAIYLLASVLSIASPTLMSGGLATIFGSGTIKTVKPPVPSTIPSP